MPGVNLHFLPTSDGLEALEEPDTGTCAESGLEEVIGDLLVQEEEELWRMKLEDALRSAVCEIHRDLKDFENRVDTRLQEAVAQVVPLAAALAQLQEENLRLRSQQETLLRRVEALCGAMGAHDIPVKKSSTFDSQDLPTGNIMPDPPLTTSQDAAAHPGYPHGAEDLNVSSAEEPSLHSQDLDHQGLTEDPVPDYPLSRSQDNTEHPPRCSNAEATPTLDVSFAVLGEPSNNLQDSDPQPQAPTPVGSVVPHPPSFATRRSLSAPSLMANIPGDDDMVLAALLMDLHVIQTSL